MNRKSLISLCNLTPKQNKEGYIRYLEWRYMIDKKEAEDLYNYLTRGMKGDN